MLTTQEIDEWKEHPATKAVFSRLREFQEALKVEALNLCPEQAGQFNVIEEIINLEEEVKE